MDLRSGPDPPARADQESRAAEESNRQGRRGSRLEALKNFQRNWRQEHDSRGKRLRTKDGGCAPPEQADGSSPSRGRGRGVGLNRRAGSGSGSGSGCGSGGSGHSEASSWGGEPLPFLRRQQPQSPGKQGNSRSSSLRSSRESSRSRSRQAASKGRGGSAAQDSDFHSLGNLFGLDGKLLTGEVSPSYVGSGPATANASEYSSKRSSTTSMMSRDSHKAPIFEGSFAGQRQSSKQLAPESEALEADEFWEEWRAEFPLAVLDSLVKFYESCTPVGPLAQRIFSLVDLEKIAARVLGVPGRVVRTEVHSQGLLDKAVMAQALPECDSESAADAAAMGNPGECLVRSLPSFLSLFRSAIDRVESEDPGALWSAEDVQNISEVFQRHVTGPSGGQRVLLTSLWQFIEELGFDDLRANTQESQRWLQSVTTRVTENLTMPSGVDKKRHTTTIGNSVSLEDILRILSAAVRERERSRRREAFRREQAARRAAGFSLMEIDDLREMHDSYQNLLPEASTGNMARMLAFLGTCGLEGLNDEEALGKILDEHPASCDGARPDRPSAPFDTFILWMKEIFVEGLGGLQWQAKGGDLPTWQDVEDRPGFTMAMLRHRLLTVPVREPEEVLPELPVDPLQMMQSRNSDNDSSSEVGMSSVASWSGASRSPSKRNASKQRSQLSSRANSRSGSRSRPGSRPRSGAATPNTSGDKGQPVVGLRRLPQASVLVDRKQFRANSPLGAASSCGPALPPSSPELQTKRKAKPVQDTSSLVLGAIADLAAVDFSTRDINHDDDGGDVWSAD